MHMRYKTLLLFNYDADNINEIDRFIVDIGNKFNCHKFVYVIVDYSISFG